MNVKEFNLWTAIITPFLEDETVDYDSLRTLLKMQEEAGNGILALGSTAEALNIRLDIRKNILDFIINENLSVPIMVGVGGINLPETKEWVDYLNNRQVHCYLLVTPLYAKPGTLGQHHWFKELLDLSNRPCMLYNIPGRTGIALDLKACEMLKEHHNFWSVKEASGSEVEFAKYVAISQDIDVYSGDDGMMPAFAKLGAKGLVSVASNAWAAETKKYVNKSLKNELSEGEIEMWSNASNSLFTASNPIPVKKLLHYLEVIKTPITRAPLSDKDLESVEELKSMTIKVTNWGKTI